jgi:lysophospholipase L1-like esterase
VVFLVLIFSWLTQGCGSGIAPLPPLNVPQTNDVIFIGDSITSLWREDPGFQAHTNWIDKGISGQNSFEIAERFFTDAISHYPKTVHILVGTNDVYPGWQACSAPSYGLLIPNDTCSNLLFMVQTAQHYGIKVVIGTIPPWGCWNDPHCGLSLVDKTHYVRIAELNNFLKTFAAEHGVTIVDYHTVLEDATGLHYAQGLTVDGIHPSSQGFMLMTSAVTAAVE